MKIRLTIPDSVRMKLNGMVSRGIAALEIDEQGHLIITLTDNTTHDLGKVSGEDGADGVSVTHEWDGTVLRVTSASGTSEADLKGRDGVDGKDGYTPVKGVDYFDGQDGYTPVKGKDYFDGKDGYTPQKGIDYFDGRDGTDGKDGYTPQKNVDYFDGKDGVGATHRWDGTVLTMTSSSGTSSADLKGERGEAGAGLTISGSVATYADLPKNLTLADAGEAYFVEADGKLYIWSGTAWPAEGEGSQFKGDKGDPGKDGYTPVKGVDYFDGKDGYTPVKNVDYFDGKDGNDGASVSHKWNGTTLEVTSASGTSSADLKGAKGDDGYTPVKGVDYFDGKDGYTPKKGVDYFDGEDGYTPVKGKDYFDGKDGQDGVSVTHSWDGTMLTVTSASGSSSADLKGDRGEDGYTPVKNKDYFDGKDGKSAFQAAVDGGYTGTEQGLNNALAAVPEHIGDNVKHITEDERNKWNDAIPAAQKGAAGGVAELDGAGKVPEAQLPALPATMTPSAHAASHKTGGSDPLSPSDIDAAPAGYGLGGGAAIAVFADWNNAVDCGFYSGKVNAPEDNAWYFGEVVRLNEDSKMIVQTAFRGQTSVVGVAATRESKRYGLRNPADGTYQWAPWEWSNPPMLAGVEYRTMGRHNDEAKYTKLIDFGKLPDTNVKNVVAISERVNIISLSGVAYSSAETNAFPVVFSTGLVAYAYTTLGDSNASIVVRTLQNLSGYSAKFILEYTKD